MRQMSKVIEAVGMKNHLVMSGGGKLIVRPFRRQEFCKCIGCVLLEVNYGKKGHNIWSEIPESFGNKASTKLRRDVRGNTDLYKVCCDLYQTFYIYAFH